MSSNFLFNCNKAMKEGNIHVSMSALLFNGNDQK